MLGFHPEHPLGTGHIRHIRGLMRLGKLERAEPLIPGGLHDFDFIVGVRILSGPVFFVLAGGVRRKHERGT